MNLLDQLNDFEFEVGEFGSCQYTGAHHVMTVFRDKVKEVGLDKTIEFFNNELGCKIVHDGSNVNLDEMILSLIQDEYNEYALEHYTPAERLAAVKEIVNKTENVDHLLQCLQARGWTLWDAANHVAVNSNIEIENPPKARGEGPILNVEVQGMNIQTGIQCAILLELGIVKEVNSFNDFDT